MESNQDVHQEGNCGFLQDLESTSSTIREYMETRHNVKLLDFDVKTSDNIDSALLVPPRYIPPQTMTAEGMGRRFILGCEGLDGFEMECIDSSIYTIFLPTGKGLRKKILDLYDRVVFIQRSIWYQPRMMNVLRVRATVEKTQRLLEEAQAFARAYRYFSAAVYGSLWEEMGHLLAFSSNVGDRALNETIGVACHFEGLLFGAKKEFFPKEEAIYTIETLVEEARSRPKSIYSLALEMVEKQVNILNFRDYELDDLLDKFDKCVDYALSASRTKPQ